MNSGVFPIPTPRGGAENHVYYLANKLAELGHNICLVSDIDQDAQFHNAVRTVRISLPDLSVFETGFYGYAARHLLGGFYAFKAARRQIYDDFDIIHVHGRFAPFLLSRFNTSGANPPVVFTLNDDPPARGMENPHLYNLSYAICEQAAEGSDAVICTSSRITSHLVSQGIPTSKFHLVPNGVDVSRFKPDGLGEGGYCLFVGSLTPRKNVGSLIDALSRIPELSCVIVGDGPDRERLRKLAAPRRSTIVFAGAVSGDKLLNLYQRASFFVLPSLSEALPLSMLEAMACGIPVCGTRVGDVPTLIKDGYNGLLAEAGNTEQLAENMTKLLENPELRVEMGRHARETIETDYSWDTIATKVVRVYTKVIDSESSRGG